MGRDWNGETGATVPGSLPDWRRCSGVRRIRKGHAYLCDECGTRTGTSKALHPGESAEEVARRLLKDKVGKKDHEDSGRRDGRFGQLFPWAQSYRAPFGYWMGRLKFAAEVLVLA